MRLGLFGKILLSFWLMLFLMSQMFWVMYANDRGLATSEQREAERIAKSLLVLLSERIKQSGPVDAQRELLLLPEDFRTTIRIDTGSSEYGQAQSNDGSHAIRAVAPDGQAYIVNYVPAAAGRGPFAIPGHILLVAAVAGLIFSAALARYLSVPLLEVRKGFRRLSEGELEVRLRADARRGDELDDLANDFNSMVVRLGQLLTARDRLLHDVSHELRSPLTRLQQAIALARQNPARTEDSMNRIEREAGKLDGMVNELLALARAESTVARTNDYLDPIAVVSSVVADAEFEAEARGVRVAAHLIALDEDSRPLIRGDAELVRRAVENVVRNALRFSPKDATVDIRVELLAAPPRYRVVVADSGQGVGHAALETLFDPFVRADPSGTGLGLAIAKRAIVAHGGSIAARNREEGGFLVEIELPAMTHDLVQ